MGASEWYYFVPYQEDVKRAFTDLQQRVLAEGNYYQGGVSGLATMADLWQAKQDEGFWEGGTHSILDMNEIIEAGGLDEVAAIAPLEIEQVRELLGSGVPGREDFEEHRKSDAYLDFPRWSGRCAVLYKDTEPYEIVFWGYSGD